MLRQIRARAKRQHTPRLLILGLDNAGKTTVLRKLNGEDLPDVEGPTQGFNTVELKKGDQHIKICDLGGQRALRDFWKDYYESTDCLIFVVDASDQRRLEEAHLTFHEVIEQLPKVPILVFANKQDLATARTPAAVAEALQLVDCRERPWQIQGCSAKTGAGLEEGIHWVLSVCPQGHGHGH